MYFDSRFIAYNDYDDEYHVRMKEEGNTGLVQAFAHLNYKLTNNLETNAGLHYQLFSLNNSYSVEPRLSLSYKLTQTTGINLAYGLHSQVHPLLYYFYRYREGDDWVARNKDLDFTKSNHFVVGINKSFTDDFFIKVDMFYQHLYDVPVSIASGSEYYSFVNLGAEFAFDAEDSTVNNGFARNYGVELTLNKAFSNGYYFLVTGTLFRSFYTDGAGIERSSAFDLGHILNVLGGVEFNLDDRNKYVLSADCKVSHIGGRRYIPYDIAASIEKGYGVRDIDNAYGAQWDDYFSFDIKIGFNINLESTTHNFFIAVDNALNTQNVVEYDWDSIKKEVDYEYQLGIFPYLGYRINF